MTFSYRLPDRLDQFALPAGDDRDHRVAQRAGNVVVLDRASDHDAAACHLARQKCNPALQDRFEPRQSARLCDRRPQHFVDEPLHVRFQHCELQLFARAEVREHAALAHLHRIGQRADRQAFEPLAARRQKRSLDDRRARHLALARWRRDRCVETEFDIQEE